MEAKGFFTDSQGGFRPKRGTNTTISKMLELVYDKINNSNSVSTVFFDPKRPLNYLPNRQQRCKVDGLMSENLPVTCGVPQGSALGL